VTHLIVSVGFGLLFIGLAQPWVLRAPRTVLVLALAYGPLLWLINIYVIAPLAGWTWFSQNSNPMIQGVAHTLYGWRLGMALKWPTPSGPDEPIGERYPSRRV
jgi:hypothetical protein